jgi:hypothetical protein
MSRFVQVLCVRLLSPTCVGGLETCAAACTFASRLSFPCLTIILVAALLSPIALLAQNTTAINVIVSDENGVAIPAARVSGNAAGVSRSCETDHVGRCTLRLPSATEVVISAQKEGFYRVKPTRFPAGTPTFEITLTHEQEIKETVDVVESPPAIDRESTSHTETLSQREIVNVPYPTSREIRNALPLLPQVVRDAAGNIHIGGASVTQTLNLIDGFNVTDPSGGAAFIHINADAVRNVDAVTGRYSVQYGQGNAILGYSTPMGDDRFRFTATNFVPSVQMKKGLNFDKWVPRFTISGPIKRGRAWFYLAPDAEYDQVIVKELPAGADRATLWRVSNLAKAQVNLTSSNILTGEFLIDDTHNRHAGLSRFTPLETTTNFTGRNYFGSIRDQHYFSSGLLLEVGFAAIRYNADSLPLGTSSFGVTPEGGAGSFFESQRSRRRRNEAIANVFLPAMKWHGRHDMKFGGTLDFLALDRSLVRRPVLIAGENGTLLRRVDFTPNVEGVGHNRESGAYLQDRWSYSDRLLIEPGLRFDEDTLLHNVTTSPRLAATYLLTQDTKFVAGVGLYHSNTNLELATRDLTGERIDTIFAPDGVTPIGPPIVSRFVVPRSGLLTPRFFNWSFGVEQKMPFQVYLTANYQEKHGKHVLAFEQQDPTRSLGTFVLGNHRSDRYRALEVTMKRTFKNVYPVFVSYTRSSARTTALLDYTSDSISLGQQFPGPLPWDVPNRFVGWGWIPFFKKFTLGYSMEISDGLPILLVNQQQQVLQVPSSVRFPRFFNATLAAERRFHVFGVFIALRGTVDNVTNQRNPIVVNNNVDSPSFLTFGSLDHRTFNMRIRFLGRSKLTTGNKGPSVPDRP